MSENLTVTPGPWWAQEDAPTGWEHGPGGRGAHYVVVDAQECVVARVYQQPHDTWSAKANARLIAAAPALLEAARMVVRLKDEWKRKDESPQVDAEYLGRLLLSAEVARAAVAQAEGGNDE